MRLEQIRLGGYMHFDEPSDLDLRALPDGLIAIVGPNGSGKSTWLDAPLASLYGPGSNNAFPSRGGSLHDYATSKSAFIETRWALDGAGTFVARVNTDGVRRVSDAILQRIDEDGCAVALNDGKISTYRDAVAARFPSKRTVLCSAFASQNRQGSFIELSQADRLTLFAELAALGHYQEKAETAKRCGEIAVRAAIALRTALTVLDGQTGSARAQVLLAEQIEVTEALAVTAQTRADALILLKTLEGERVGLELETRDAAVADTEANGLRNRLAAIDREQAACIDRLATADAEREKTLQEIASRIAGNQTLIAKADAIRAQAEEKRRYDALLVEARARIDASQATRTAAVADLHGAEVRLLQADQAAQRLAIVKRQAAGIDAAPFGERCAPCDFMAAARDARALLPDLERAAANISELEATADQRRRSVDQFTQRAIEAEAAYKALQVGVAALTLARYEPDLALAETRLAHYRQQERDVEARRAEVFADVNARCGALDVEKVEQMAALTVAQETVARTKGARARLADIEIRLTRQREIATAAETQIARLEMQQQQNFAAQVTLEQQTMVAIEARRRLGIIETEQLAWQTLAKACGRDGLPKLEIDAMGPAISDITNDLLRAGFGARFSLQIVTQVATADGKDQKERFTVEVLDNWHGAEIRDIGDLSGGEKVLVEEALRAGIAVFLNLRNRYRIETSWRDETTGALSAENVSVYVAMLRRMHELGGFAQTLFVTHSADAASLADAQIRLAAGQPTIALPPYAEVA